ncbi:MAG: hypothetical protein WCZ86_10355, partial [Desulfurivibrionaceae bacterium]
GSVSHQHIPDTPFVESERRQILFGTAIGIPTFFVHKDTPNRFLRSILKKTKNTRTSHRYPGYLRVLHQEYRLALLAVIREEAAELVEGFGFDDLLGDLELRLREPSTHGAAGRLTAGILAKGGADSPYDMSAREFNLAAERYYREELRQEQISEGWEYVAEDIQAMAGGEIPLSLEMRDEVTAILGTQEVDGFLRQTRDALRGDSLGPENAARLLQLMIIAEDLDTKRQKHSL